MRQNKTYALYKNIYNPKLCTYVSGIANRAHVTTVASKIFQPSLQYDPGCKIKPKTTI